MLLFAEAFDAEADGLAGAEEGGRLHAHADAGGRAGGDDVAGVEREELAEVADELLHAEDHRGGGAVLAALAVDFEPELEVLRVGDFVFGDEPGAEGAEGVAAFAFGPLAAAVFLERAFGDVVGDAVAGDVVEGVGLAYVFGLGSPMTTPSSTSQSVWVEPRGMRMSSLGPTIALVAFMKRMGSLGMAAPVSAACSE